MGKKKDGCCCACCTPMVTVGVLIFLGVVIACLGAGSIPFFEDQYKQKVKEQLVLSKGNEAYDNWKNPPSPVYMQFFIFNYTNHEDVVNNNAKPNVTQHGPYSYREIRDNHIIDYNVNNITYLQNYSYVFDPDTSCVDCSEEDYFFTPNTPILTIGKKLHDAKITSNSSLTNIAAMELLNLFLEKTFSDSWTLFKHLPVRKLLWGYTDPLLNNIVKLEEVIAKLPFHFDLPKISAFVALQHNGTSGALNTGNLTIDTGKQDINQVQKITRWRGKKEAPYWLSDYGDMINGSDGSHTRPFLPRDDTVYVFTTDLCRALFFKYEKDRTVKDISLYRFTTTPELFANHSVNPDNGAFCNKEKCWGSGLLSVGQCQDGDPPVFMSAPHFYQGDPSLVAAINGLHPEESLHATHLDIEPITGVTMVAHKRLQINILVQKTEYIRLMNKLESEDNFLPVLWVHESAEIDQASADKFKKDVLHPRYILNVVSYCVIGFGTLLVLIALIVGIAYKSRKNTYSRLDDDDDVPKIL